MDWMLLARLGERAIRLIAEIAADERWPNSEIAYPTPAARCAECGSEPWIIRWGTIRVGQQLDGYYYQATTGREPKLLCRECWHRSIGVADPLAVPKA